MQVTDKSSPGIMLSIPHLPSNFKIILFSRGLVSFTRADFHPKPKGLGLQSENVITIPETHKNVNFLANIPSRTRSRPRQLPCGTRLNRKAANRFQNAYIPLPTEFGCPVVNAAAFEGEGVANDRHETQG